jgi:hypothetical protein
METPYRRDCSQSPGQYVRTYWLFKSEGLSIHTKLILYNALIRSIRVYSYACLTWEYAAGAHFLKLQLLQNRVLSATGAHRYANCKWLLKFLTCMIT